MLITKQFGGDETKDQIHFSTTYLRNAADAAGERENRGYVLVGYSRLLSPQTLLVADVFGEWDQMHDEESNLIEVGVIQAINDKLKLGAGIGTGIGDESPHLTATLGVEYDF